MSLLIPATFQEIEAIVVRALTQKRQTGQTNYSTSKTGIRGFTRPLAQEVARKGVTVNTISPSYIATEIVTAVPEEISNKII